MASYTTSKDLGSGEILSEVPYKARYYSYAGKHYILPYPTNRMEAAKSSYFLKSQISDLPYSPIPPFLSLSQWLTNYGSEASLAIDSVKYFHGKVAHKLRFIAIHLHKAGKEKASKVSHAVSNLAITV